MGLLSHLRAICIVVLLGLATWPTHQAVLKTLSQACLCDVTDNCDSECCCDQECLAGLNSILGQYNKCADDGFGIPLCSNVNITDLHIADLYSGLRTIYTVIANLLRSSKGYSVFSESILLIPHPFTLKLPPILSSAQGSPKSPKPLLPLCSHLM